MARQMTLLRRRRCLLGRVAVVAHIPGGLDKTLLDRTEGKTHIIEPLWQE